MPEHLDQGLSRGVRTGDALAHERGADTAPLLIRRDGERSEGDHRESVGQTTSGR